MTAHNAREPEPIIGATWHAHDAPLGICGACGRPVDVQLGADGGVIVPAGYCGHCSVTTVWDQVDTSD